jgi:hypothetical protein
VLFQKIPPCVNGTYYAGADRMPWFDVGEDFYSGLLPDKIRLILQSIRDNNYDFSGLPLVSGFGCDYAVA